MRLFGRISERHTLWMNALADQLNLDLRVARLSITFRSASTLLFGAERVIVVWMGALAVLDAALTVGMLFAFLSYLDQFSQRVGSLIDKLFELHMLSIQGERVADIVFTDREEDDGGDEVDTTALPADIELRDYPSAIPTTGRRSRNRSFRRPEAAHRARPCAISLPAHPCTGRSHQPSGPSQRTDINNAIRHLAMTRIIVAHRPDTIAMAERIVILDGGEICVDQPAFPPR